MDASHLLKRKQQSINSMPQQHPSKAHYFTEIPARNVCPFPSWFVEIRRLKCAAEAVFVSFKAAASGSDMRFWAGNAA